jgi:hypothetical protein
MDKERDIFNSAARRIFRGFVAHAGLVNGTGMGIANGGLVVKNIPLLRDLPVLRALYPGAGSNRLELLAGASLLAMSAAAGFSDRFPKLKRLTGGCGLAGVFMLAASAVGLPGQNIQIASQATAALWALSMIFERHAQSPARPAPVEAENTLWRRVVRHVKKYSVSYAAGSDLFLSTIPMGVAAAMRGDQGLKVTVAMWILGGLGGMANDNNFKRRVGVQPKVPHIS